MWEWINDRADSTHLKAPSVSEQFDSLLKAITGRSLKDEAKLWEGFQNLRKARNSFVHGGVGVIGGKAVDRDQALTLVGVANEILDWIDGLLPVGDRRPKFNETYNIESDIPITQVGLDQITSRLHEAQAAESTDATTA